MKTRQLLSNSAIATIMGRRQECVNVLSMPEACSNLRKNSVLSLASISS